jgi:hypothetical protein
MDYDYMHYAASHKEERCAYRGDYHIRIPIAMTLKCGHEICTFCLEQNISNNSIKCKMCGKITENVIKLDKEEETSTDNAEETENEKVVKETEAETGIGIVEETENEKVVKETEAETSIDIVEETEAETSIDVVEEIEGEKGTEKVTETPVPIEPPLNLS